MNKLCREKMTANILFSGLGCQERGLQNSNIFDLEVLATYDDYLIALYDALQEFDCEYFEDFEEYNE